MKTYKLLTLLMFVSTLYVGCSDDYLDEAPSKSQGVVPTTIEDIAGLLNDLRVFSQENSSELIYSTDDFGINIDYFNADVNEFTAPVAHEYTWNTEFPALDARGTRVWNGEWKKIFNANLVLLALNDVEGTVQEKANLKAEAHFIRAYSYFLLANTYCLSLKGNEQEMGLPIKRSTSYEETLERASLQDTYDFITEDLEEALKINRQLEKFNGLDRIWRASTVAVNGFAARYYLALHDYEKAQKYAQDALSEKSTLINFNTDIVETSIIVNIESDGDPSTSETAEIYNGDYIVNTSVINDIFYWTEAYYNREMSSPIGQLWPSEDLLSTYNASYDLRYKHFVVENLSYLRGSDGIGLPLYSQSGYQTVFSHLISGPTAAEMLLIKAECQIRQGSWADGLQTANVLRANRIDVNAPADVINLSATSQSDALVKVLEERRRELPFVLRWYDLKRYNSNEDPSDDVDNITRNFYPYSQVTIDHNSSLQTYTLPKGSRRYAHPIPNQEIITSGGVIKQNEY
ncbi:SusD-like starch-binding protein associating with outer membrane [Cellulophaga sp. RHA19]|uniref:RagB/SusD family nutrient uptake outer membrane protein n=1 Tax=Cellulophaga sp. RHA19 TaxID=1798237 RepID=UPI000C2C1448|nr:RagB/SusD family nutrient uptake outer membrane protein [Cellulophaga sp. RHA19]PKB44835.1 SusD-like starch-binding protein associating with outer membrane [Cellulophaga sp. RHA19]